MTKVLCIVGLPGSGKTFLANRLASKLLDVKVIDDIRTISELPENGETENLIIVDPNFCFDEVRTRADQFLSKNYDVVEWLFFENSPEKCLVNVELRNDGRKVEGLIRILHKNYHPPMNAMQIWQPQTNA